MNIETFLCLLSSYFIGSIPFGYIIAKLRGIDIQKQGSGNIGATNVFRTLGPTLGIIVFILDALKGTFAVVVATSFISNPIGIISCAGLVILGHMFPIFLGFKGGKGAATGVGVLLGLDWRICIICFILVALIILLTRYVSLASITVPIIATILMYIFNKPLAYTITTGIITLFIIIKHTSNIKRLLKGQERKFF